MANIRRTISNSLLNVGFVSIHLGCILVIWAGWSPAAVITCIALYIVRMFGLTAGYHRYLSHRSFKTSRIFQFLLSGLGASTVQNGPLWWASHHRHHHRHSDTDEDVHSPISGTIWHSHVGWILSKKFDTVNESLIPDLLKFRELHWLNRYFMAIPVLMSVGLYFLGEWLGAAYGTSGFQMVVWGFFISTTILYHGTFTVNSIAHLWGGRRFQTTDQSRNNLFVALITLGEGWHNNHHRYLSSERQGFYWWEIDVTHYVLTAFSWVGLVWDLKTPPKNIYDEAKGIKHHTHPRIGDKQPARRVEEEEFSETA